MFENDKKNIPEMIQFASMLQGTELEDMVGEVNQKAVKLFELAADHKCEAAVLKLAYMYEKGQGVGQNNELALKYLKKAAIDCNNPSAMLRLGYVYEEGQLGVKTNIPTALNYFKNAADSGAIPEAMYKTACLFNGYGQYRGDYANRACHYAKLAADHGYRDGYWKLWECIQNSCSDGWNLPGVGTDKNKKQTAVFKYLKQACEWGMPEAMHYMGLAYLRGKGVEEDVQQAAQYLTKAAEQEDTIGSASSLWCYRDWFPQTILPKVKIIAILSNSAEQFKHPADLLSWGELCQKGWTFDGRMVVKKDIQKAFKCYTEAVSGGDWETHARHDAMDNRVVEGCEYILKNEKAALFEGDAHLAMASLLKHIATKLQDVRNGYSGYSTRISAEKLLEQLQQLNEQNTNDDAPSDSEGAPMHTDGDNKCIVQ